MTYVEDKILEWYDADPAVQEQIDSAEAVVYVVDEEAAAMMVLEGGEGEEPPPSVPSLDLSKVPHEIKAKAKAHVHKDTITPGDFTMHGVTITIVSATVEGDNLAVVVSASDANGPLPSATGGKHLFHNPPTMVRFDETTGEDDPVSVSKQFIYDSVTAYARNHGWNR